MSVNNIQQEMLNRYQAYQHELAYLVKPYQMLGVNGRETIETVATENGMLRKHVIKSNFKENGNTLYSGVVVTEDEVNGCTTYFVSDFRVPSDEVALPVYGGYALNLEDGQVDMLVTPEKTQMVEDVVRTFEVSKEQAMQDSSCFVSVDDKYL